MRQAPSNHALSIVIRHEENLKIGTRTTDSSTHIYRSRHAAQQTGSKIDPASVGSRPSGASRSAPGRAGEVTFSQGSGNATAGFNSSSPPPSRASSAAGRAGELTFSKGSGNATAGFNSPSSPKLPEVVLAVGGGGGGGDVPRSGSSGGSGGSGGDESSPRPGSGGPEETPDAAPWTLFAVGLGGAMFAIYDRIVKPQKEKEAAAAVAAAAAAAAAPVCVKKSCCAGGKAAKA